MNISKKFKVFVPAFNEERNIQFVINDLLTTFDLDQIIVINDGSTDNTQAILENCGVEVVHHEFNSGVGFALKSAAKISRARNLDFFIFFDGDGQHIAFETTSLLKIFDGSGMVIGSRLIAGPGNLPLNYDIGIAKKAAIFILAKIIEKKYGLRIHDITSGFRIYGADTFEIIISIKQNYYLADTVIVLSELLNKGILIKETFTNMNDRMHGTSSSNNFISFMNYLRVFITIIKRQRSG